MVDMIQTCKTILETLYTKANEGFVARPVDKHKIFITFCYGAERARTVCGTGRALKAAFEVAMDAALELMSEKSEKAVPKWVMIDIVTNETVLTIQEYYKLLKKSRRGYLRHGISFDESYDIAFLEQEIYGNSLIKYVNKNDQYFHIANIKNYLKKHKDQDFNIEADLSKPIILFDTKNYFYDEGIYIPLESSRDSLRKGLRKIQFKGTRGENASTVLNLMTITANALVSTLQKDGRFIYGYYPCYSVVLPGYNVPRHALAVYALADMYLINPLPEYKEAALRALDYMLEAYVYNHDEDTAYITEPINMDEWEIKLGAIGLAIIAIIKCTEITDTNYLPILRKLGNGILSLQDVDTGNFTHVLHYPNMEVKENFRIVYYAGEASYALLRLYAIDKNPKWMNSIIRAFDFFMANDYHNHNDNWLSYAINELIQYKGTDKYFKFGLKNAFNDLDYIIKRDTTSNTYLELLNAAYFLITKIQDLGKSYLLESYDLEKLYLAMDVRFERQLASVMFPEMAMFFKSPETILHTIFIRHQSFRIRNDDIAHHIMGYCNYYRNKLMPKRQRWSEKISVDITFSAGQMILGGIAENSKVAIRVKPIPNKNAHIQTPEDNVSGAFTTDQLNYMLMAELLDVSVLVNSKPAKAGVYAKITVDISDFNMTSKQRSTLTGIYAKLNSPHKFEAIGGFLKGDLFEFNANEPGLFGIMIGDAPVSKLPPTLPPPAPQNVMRFTVGSGEYIRNGKSAMTNDVPFVNLENYQTMLPLSVLAEGLGGKMEWMDLTKAVLIYLPDRTLVLHTDSLLDDANKPKIINDNRIFVTLSYVTDKMGVSVMLDGSTVIVSN